MTRITYVITKSEIKRIAALMKREKATAIVLRGIAVPQPNSDCLAVRDVYFHGVESGCTHKV